MNTTESPCGARPARQRGAGHLSKTHPLAEIAARHCTAHRGPLRGAGIGGIACGACWERAIRDDERMVVAFDLSPSLRPDPSYVDTIAVELLCRGERVPTTAVERAEAIRRLNAAGLAPSVIGERIGVSHTTVVDTLAGLREAIPLVPARTCDDATRARGAEQVA